MLCTLLHEAAHGLANARGIQDTSRQGRYHNHRYAQLASELGLDVARDPRIGWSLTTLSEPTAHRYAAVLDELRAALVLWRYLDTLAGRTATSRNLLACLCPCQRRIRIARATLAEAPVICGACQGEFEPVDT